MTVQRLELIRQAALNLQRRRAQWQESFNRLAQTPARGEDEALAKAQALALMIQARP